MDYEEFFREDFDRIEQYKPGEQPTEEGWVKLNTNENPYPPPQVILDEIKMSVNDKLRLYPDPTAKYLRQMISSVLLVDKNTLTNPRSVFIDNGSDGILENIMKTIVDPGDQVDYFYPSYGMYRVLSMCYRAKRNEVKLTEDFSIPDEAYSLKGKLMFVWGIPRGVAPQPVESTPPFSDAMLQELIKVHPERVQIDMKKDRKGDYVPTEISYLFDVVL